MKLLEIGEVLGMSPEARQSFEKLVQARMDRQNLAARLCMIPFLASKPVPLIPGKTQNPIRDFPKQLTKWAQRIEEANARGLLYELKLESWIETHEPNCGNIGRGASKEMLNTFKLLPDNLRAYAAYWQDVVGRRAQRRPQRGGFKPQHNLQRLAIAQLIEAVEKAAGTPFYNHIALLLDAAFEAANRQPSMKLDPDNLRVYYTQDYKPLFDAVSKARPPAKTEI